MENTTSMRCQTNCSHSHLLHNVTYEDISQEQDIISILGFVIGTLSLVMNMIFLIGARQCKEYKSAFHTFIRNLCVADIIASGLFMIIQNPAALGGALGTIETTHFLMVAVLPYLFRSMPWMFFTAHLLTLLALTVNQYVAVCRPWQYTELSGG